MAENTVPTDTAAFIRWALPGLPDETTDNLLADFADCPLGFFLYHVQRDTLRDPRYRGIGPKTILRLKGLLKHVQPIEDENSCRDSHTDDESHSRTDLNNPFLSTANVQVLQRFIDAVDLLSGLLEGEAGKIEAWTNHPPQAEVVQAPLQAQAIHPRIADLAGVPALQKPMDPREVPGRIVQLQMRERLQREAKKHGWNADVLKQMSKAAADGEHPSALSFGTWNTIFATIQNNEARTAWHERLHVPAQQ